jgi:SAM-dependent methyltransferase
VSLVRQGRAIFRGLVPEPWRARLNYELIGEPAVIKAELKRLSGKPWRDFTGTRPTVRMDERVVEIPWVLSRYSGERRVLDVGSANAASLYLHHLTALGIPELHGVDLSNRPVKGIRMTQADVRRMPFADSSFDLVLCVSTLEHIGSDNSGYGVTVGREEGGDVAALIEIRRVLTDTGRLLLTVPFGRLEDYGWFRQYDLATWRDLLGAGGLYPAEEAFFGYSTAGWVAVDDPVLLRSKGYREMGAPAATGVVCADVRAALLTT